MKPITDTHSVPTEQKVTSMQLFDSLMGGNSEVVPVIDNYNGGAANPRIYKVVCQAGSPCTHSFFANVGTGASQMSGYLAAVMVTSSNPVDLEVHIEEYVDGDWKDLGLAYSASTDTYLQLKGTPAEGEPSSQDWNRIPVGIEFDGTPIRLRLVNSGATTLKAQFLTR